VLKDIGYDVYGIDINDCGNSPNFKFIKGNILDYDFGMKFDVIIAISTIEHVGLESYEQTKVDNNGDIETMKMLRKYANKYVILTVPFGKAHHPANFERVYDTPRLKKLIEEFIVVREEYYANITGGPNDTWEKVDSLTAMDKDAVIALLLKV
jgi:23S rRNA U2552 (ribose-2'-O)-methylase RlmE/FtsJ